MTTPTRNAGVSPLPYDLKMTQTPSAPFSPNPAPTPKGLPEAACSIRSLASKQNTRNNFSGIGAFLAWICNCCKTLPAEEPTIRGTGSPEGCEPPKEGKTRLYSIKSMEEMPGPEPTSSAIQPISPVPIASLSISPELASAAPRGSLPIPRITDDERQNAAGLWTGSSHPVAQTTRVLSNSRNEELILQICQQTQEQLKTMAAQVRGLARDMESVKDAVSTIAQELNLLTIEVSSIEKRVGSIEARVKRK